MIKEILLVRHGNTFTSHDKVIWAGARTDLPLTPEGTRQAQTLGQRLLDASYMPQRILTGPLLRTREHAEHIRTAIGFSGDIEISETLREIDYGRWEGLSTDEIKALPSGNELTAWDKQSIWPESPGWRPTEAVLTQNVVALLTQAPNIAHSTLVITSNGILRFFGRAAINPPTDYRLKVRTGHWCRLEWTEHGWRITDWNRAPSDAF